MSDYDPEDADLSNADLIAKYRTCKLKEVNEDLLLDRLEAAVAEIDRLVATGLANVETTGKAARFLADLDKVEAEIAQWKAVAAGYCKQLSEAWLRRREDFEAGQRSIGSRDPYQGLTRIDMSFEQYLDEWRSREESKEHERERDEKK